MGAPKYLDIYESLKRRCQKEAVGVRLPSERALAQEFSASVMTVRRALSRLSEEGWVRRNAGSGTYVNRPTVYVGPWLTSFTEDMTRRGLRPSSEVLRFETVVPDVQTVARLALRPGEKAVLLERLRHADGEPMCHEIGIYPARFSDVLQQGDLEGSTHKALAESGTVPRSTERSVRAVVAPESECSLLGLPSNSPALEITDVFSDALGQPMQYVRSRYRFDRYEVLTVIDDKSNSVSRSRLPTGSGPSPE